MNATHEATEGLDLRTLFTARHCQLHAGNVYRDLPKWVISSCAKKQLAWVVAMPLSTTYCSESGENGLILGFGGTDVSEIRPAVVTLRKASGAITPVSRFSSSRDLALP